VTADDPLLSVEGIDTAYGRSHVLRNVSLTVERGEVVGLLGRNGAGKTTTLRSISGVVPPRAGKIRFKGEDVTGLPEHQISRRGISYVAEERSIFPDLTVLENLRMGQVKGEGIYTVEEIFDILPRLEERKSFRASHLSGGEQQMLVIARALVSPTELLLLDEPTEGLAPQIVEDVIRVIDRIRDEDVSILLVEQNVNTVFRLADRNYIIAKGEIAYEGSTEELQADEETQDRLLGVGASLDEHI